MILAMKRQEGFGRRTLAFRAHNPGNLNYGPWARKHGAIGDIDGISVFPTLPVGLNAMGDLIKQVYGRRTIYEMLAGDPEHGVKGYAPKVMDQFHHMGNPKLYSEHVATWMNEMADKRSSAQHGDCDVGATPHASPDPAPKPKVVHRHLTAANSHKLPVRKAKPEEIVIRPHGR
jgi:hypothetical protein